MVELLEGWLRHKSDMVNIEAARAMCEMKGISVQQLSKAISGEWNLVFDCWGGLTRRF